MSCCSFSYYLSSTNNSVTGDGNTWVLIPDTKIFDTQNAMNYSNGRWTVPYSGCYQINFAINYGNIQSNHTSGFAQIKTTHRQYSFGDCNPYSLCSPSGGNLAVFSGSALVDCSAGDQIWVLFIVNGGSRVVNAIGINTAGDPNTFFQGFYVGPTV